MGTVKKNMGPRNTQNRRKAQTAVEYLLLIAAAIVFVTIIAYVVKSAVGGGR